MNIRDTQMVAKLLSIAENSDWWTEISQAERNSIEKGLQDLSENKVYTYSDIEKQYEKYL